MLRTRVLITGANGLLGQALVRRLSSTDDHDVLATARDDAPRFDVPCDYTQLDVTTPDAVETLLTDYDPDVVVNCAAVSDVTECDEDRNRAWAVNARAVRTLAKQCRSVGARLIQLSTDFVFNGKRGPYEEDARPDPVNYYGRTKLAGENALREFDFLDWAVVRTVLLYGTAKDLSRSNVVLWMIDRLSEGKPLRVVDDQWRTPTYVRDLADGIVRLIDRDRTGIYHMSGREMITIHELARTVADVLGFDPSPIEPVSSDYFEDAVDRPPKTGFIILKAETELGYDPRPLREGLRTVGKELGVSSPS
ncbi:MAG: dTDP-4-dehydrorhamnose reductase [Bacteroidetes bacterium QH_7_62_13]|nr:MAG: dTDP-4-dehydrorhamnose reductase [Bacteroidetes bacterium QH_7_62_13]